MNLLNFPLVFLFFIFIYFGGGGCLRLFSVGGGILLGGSQMDEKWMIN